jgi:acyl-CoA dehydrogenase
MEYQSYICGKNHWLLEPDLNAILGKYWPDLPRHEPSLLEFGALAGGRAYEVAEHVDRGAAPILVMHDVDGRRIDRAQLSPATPTCCSASPSSIARRMRAGRGISILPTGSCWPIRVCTVR